MPVFDLICNDGHVEYDVDVFNFAAVYPGCSTCSKPTRSYWGRGLASIIDNTWKPITVSIAGEDKTFDTKASFEHMVQGCREKAGKDYDVVTMSKSQQNDLTERVYENRRLRQQNS